MQIFSLYIHIPFCKQLCTYCDFNTYSGMQALIPEYVDALGKECESLSFSFGKTVPVHSIYFGGGTPNVLSIDEFCKLFDRLDKCFDILPDAEVSCEVNPDSIDVTYLRGLYELGVNRLSIGMQSADEAILELLGREHSYHDVSQVVKYAREVGFKNLSLDLIFGVPGQSMDVWCDSLDQALILHSEHLSLYSLTLEDSTALHRSVTRGLVSPIDTDLSAEMYEVATDKLAAKGFKQYEISNWARESDAGGIHSCLHHLQYWYNRPYLGVGAGAHGYTNGVRIANVDRPRVYIQRLADSHQHTFPCTPASETIQPLTLADEMKETLLMTLRLTEEGISTRDFYCRFGKRLESVFARELKELIQFGLIETLKNNGDRIRLTRKGRMLSNQVFLRFI